MKVTITRRDLLALAGGGALVSASLAGCGFLSIDPEVRGRGDDAGGRGDPNAKESPTLREQVDAGQLDPLTERLPTDPLVVEVPEAGLYGGTWASVTRGMGDTAAFSRIVGYEGLLRKDPMITETVPNLCTDIAANGDGTEYTLRLRAGTRWSDGEPFGADDIVFAIEDVWGNAELYGGPPSWLRSDGGTAQVRKVDNRTVKIIFGAPNGLFPEVMASSEGVELVRFPRHYVSQFLPAFNDQVEAEAEAAGFQTWTAYFEARAGSDARWNNVDLPVLAAWQISRPLGEGSRVVFERNPYFWKTDQDGRQLPYIDTLAFEVVMESEAMVLQATSGAVDLVYRHVNTSTNKPVFAGSRGRGGYHLVDNRSGSQNAMIISLNLANRDLAKRDLYQNKDFRIGLSHAIDREALIDGVWQRQGEPWQCGPTMDSPYYDEDFAKQYTEYELDKAEAHLELAGTGDRDSEGFRTLPGGSPLTINLDLANAWIDEWASAASMIKEMWADVGIRLNIKIIDRTLFYDRKAANQHDANIWYGGGGLGDEILDPRWYLPFSDESNFATSWAAWGNTDGAKGDEPPAPAKEQIRLYQQLRQSPDAADREALFRQILAIGREQFWAIGTISAPNPYLLVKNRLKNVIGSIPDSWTYLTPAHANPEMWFLDGDR
jgi:peptide/nickel transport system substrate-binding protein